MSHFMSNQHTECWRSVMYEQYVPTAPTTEKPNVQEPKDHRNYSEQDFQKFELDIKAFAMLVMALVNEVYVGLLHYSNAKELWGALKEPFGGTTKVIENNRGILNHKYETSGHVKVKH
ncbi:hypothetical protein HanRHA438_Chr03g0104551 [Helianthus annuus]|uniref:Uncharacterized protein n=1 Tax=Helianthus annuus TaxID=4232 RepID=A0A9K3JCH6_HELAN|nr:hypothetical protein HanXRQr2_Chr03g0093431 [Helianthus annuus]KAJ0934183.1 hypothetical protein HanRHA438_Chr03g0104551 [Helianthus annuus]